MSTSKPLMSVLLVVLFFNSAIIKADNPIIQTYADPHMKIWNGKMYISVGKDKAPDNKTCLMPYWSIFSSTDLINWTNEKNIMPAETYLGAGYEGCWATDITTRNGKYYFYFSNHNEGIGVLVADSPKGPFIDVLKKPLVVGQTKYDPTVFTDDDGQYYLIFGRDGGFNGKIIHYQIARLNKDMISFAEPPRDLLTDNQYGFGNEKAAKDENYLHKHNGIYYLSCSENYVTSTSLYGPYTNFRKAGDFGVAGHSSYNEYNGQCYLAWENTCDPYGNRRYRQIMLTYLHYKDNGNMVDDPFFIKNGKGYAFGVGQYNAKWDTIQAEWFFKISGSAKKRDCPNGGFEIQNIKNGDYLNFPNMKNLSANATINFRLSSENSKGSTIEIRKDSEKGEILGTCKVASTGSWKTYQTVSCKLKNEAGTANLYFVFKGKNDELIHLDWFNFSK